MKVTSQMRSPTWVTSDTSDHATHRSVRGRLNGNERADDHGKRAQHHNA